MSRASCFCLILFLDGVEAYVRAFTLILVTPGIFKFFGMSGRAVADCRRVQLMRAAPSFERLGAEQPMSQDSGPLK